MRSRTWIRPSAKSGSPSGSDRLIRVAVWYRFLCTLGAAVALLGFVGTLRAQTIPPELREFLTAHAHFDESDLRDLASGKPVAKLLATKSKSEVAGVGAIRIAVPRDFFLTQIDDIVGYKQAQADPAPEIGRFDSPPQLANLDGLTLQERDIDSLRDCRPGDCGLKLPAGAIERFRKEIRWSDNGADKSANRLFREFLLARAEDYVKSGDTALAAYHDKHSPVSLAAEFGELVADAPYLGRYAPRLADCLVRFPQCEPAVQSFLYWSKEKFGHGLQTVISVTQVMSDREGTGENGWIWQASKQLYADHYLECSLGLTLMVESSQKGGANAFYLVYLNRSRSDVLKGNLSGLVRGIIQGGVSGEMSDRLERIRKRMESLWAAQASRTGPPPGRE
jgi:hypothetical protein